MRGRILVVDDEESIRHFLSEFLEIKDCEVRTAGSAEEALEILAEVDPDVALLDMVLPGMNGLRLLGKIRQAAPDTVVMMMTSQNCVQTPIRAINMGAFDYLQKPFQDLEQVWSTVQKAMAKNAEAREMRVLLGAGP